MSKIYWTFKYMHNFKYNKQIYLAIHVWVDMGIPNANLAPAGLFLFLRTWEHINTRNILTTAKKKGDKMKIQFRGSEFGQDWIIIPLKDVWASKMSCKSYLIFILHLQLDLDLVIRRFNNQSVPCIFSLLFHPYVPSCQDFNLLL